MADAILQSGVNYRTVVYPRVSAIIKQYPEAKSLRGVRAIIDAGHLAEFLQWRHAIKLGRFLDLAFYFEQKQVDTAIDLRACFSEKEFRNGLLRLPGVGPKTVDYMGCLVGVDAIAVDRHIRSFAYEAGVLLEDYDRLCAVFSYAADLLEVSRREFDFWVWTTISTRQRSHNQLSLPI